MQGSMILPTSGRSNTNRTSSIEDVTEQEKPMHDLVIRGATVVNGLGHDPIRADVAVRDGRIAAIGEAGKDASEIVDAGGLALMPGIIDLHTHYDAQVTWDPSLSPSPSLGVTTAIMGNCGFGIVPAPPAAARHDHAEPGSRRGYGPRRIAHRYKLEVSVVCRIHDDAARARRVYEPRCSGRAFGG